MHSSCLKGLSLFATSQRVAVGGIGHTWLYLWNHLEYLTASAHHKGLVCCTSSLQKAVLGSADAFVYQALHLYNLFLFHAFSPSSGLPYCS